MPNVTFGCHWGQYESPGIRRMLRLHCVGLWAGSAGRCWMDCQGLWNLWLLFCLEIVWTHMSPRFPVLLFKTKKLVLRCAMLTEEDGLGVETHMHRSASSVWLTSPSSNWVFSEAASDVDPTWGHGQSRRAPPSAPTKWPPHPRFINLGFPIPPLKVPQYVI